MDLINTEFFYTVFKKAAGYLIYVRCPAAAVYKAQYEILWSFFWDISVLKHLHGHFHGTSERLGCRQEGKQRRTEEARLPRR